MFKSCSRKSSGGPYGQRCWYNSDMKLSQARADSVVNAFVSQDSIDAKRLAAYGVRPLAPVARNRTEEGRARNRRVELVEQ